LTTITQTPLAQAHAAYAAAQLKSQMTEQQLHDIRRQRSDAINDPAEATRLNDLISKGGLFKCHHVQLLDTSSRRYLASAWPIGMFLNKVQIFEQRPKPIRRHNHHS
jgi:hypothetical protein